MRIHVGPGYRAHVVSRGAVVYLLLLGGDRSSRKQDIERATKMARTLNEECAMTKFAPFDAADYLDNEAIIAEYITAELEDPNPDVFLTTVRDVARAPGYDPTRRNRRSRAREPVHSPYARRQATL